MAGATLEVEGRVVHEDCFDEDIVEELARRITVAGGEALFETNGATYSLEPVGVEQSFLLGAGVVHGVDQMRVDGRLRVGKVCISADDLARVANDDGFIDREFELCNTGGQNRELSPKGIDKGVGVARALAYLGREGNARTFGFGDSGNDLGMLAAVETAVAMGNAMPEVKAVADYVTDDVVHDAPSQRCSISASSNESRILTFAQTATLCFCMLNRFINPNTEVFIPFAEKIKTRSSRLDKHR